MARAKRKKTFGPHNGFKKGKSGNPDGRPIKTIPAKRLDRMVEQFGVKQSRELFQKYANYTMSELDEEENRPTITAHELACCRLYRYVANSNNLQMFFDLMRIRCGPSAFTTSPEQGDDKPLVQRKRILLPLNGREVLTEAAEKQVIDVQGENIGATEGRTKADDKT